MDKTFLLQVGAPKSGTTWLYSQLAARDDCDMGFMKEYHVWDGLTLPTERAFVERTEDVLRRARRGPWRLLKPRFAYQAYQMSRRMRLYENPEDYFDYFTRLLSRDSIRLTADMTPSYCGLSIDTLERIAQGFKSRGIPVRVIYLIRDPVERVWSAVRMHRQRPPRDQHTEKLRELDETNHIRERFLSEKFRVRSSYDQTLQRLETAFAPEVLYVQFYEELFSQRAAKEIGDHLGLPDFQPKVSDKINTTERGAPLPVELQREIAGTYRSAYEAVIGRFGLERTRANWPSATLLEG